MKVAVPTFRLECVPRISECRPPKRHRIATHERCVTTRNEHMNPVFRWMGGRLATYLAQPIRGAQTATASLEQLEATLKPGDVLLVEGNTRVIVAIKYLTQSTWSHAMFYIGDALGSPAPGEAPKVLVEADMLYGIRAVPLSDVSGMNTRICRPVGLSKEDLKAVINFTVSHIGGRYDLKNVFDLARYLMPTPPVPVRWRRPCSPSAAATLRAPSARRWWPRRSSRCTIRSCPRSSTFTTGRPGATTAITKWCTSGTTACSRRATSTSRRTSRWCSPPSPRTSTITRSPGPRKIRSDRRKSGDAQIRNHAHPQRDRRRGHDGVPFRQARGVQVHRRTIDERVPDRSARDRRQGQRPHLLDRQRAARERARHRNAHARYGVQAGAQGDARGRARRPEGPRGPVHAGSRRHPARRVPRGRHRHHAV